MKRLLCLTLCLFLMVFALSGCKKEENPSSGMEFASMPDGAPSLAETYQDCLARYDGLVTLARQNGWEADETVRDDLASIKTDLETVASVLNTNGGNHDGDQQTAMAVFLRTTVNPLMDRIEELVSAPAVTPGE